MFNFLKRFMNMDQALHVGKRAGLVREIASGKGGFKKKASRRIGELPTKALKAGRTGLSEVSAAILKDRGSIVDRSTRRKVAKRLGKPFVGYTTGTSYHQLPHQVGKQLQKSNAYFAKINSKEWRKAASER
jgi:hypothetical protein